MPPITTQNIVQELTLRHKKGKEEKEILAYKKWEQLDNTIFYRFIDKPEDIKNKFYRYVFTDIFYPFSKRQRNAFQLAASGIEEVIPVTFIERSNDEMVGNGEVQLWNMAPKSRKEKIGDDAVTYQSLDYTNTKTETCILANSVKRHYRDTTPVIKNDYFTSIMRHEICHALGMGHPNDHKEMHQIYTTMSYEGVSKNGIPMIPSTLMNYDILTLQTFYGQNKETRKGSNYYCWKNDKLGELQCLWDAGGQDTFDTSQAKVSQVFDMRGGQYSCLGQHNDGLPLFMNFSLAYTVDIENYNGSDKGDIVFLNKLNNAIQLGNGNDIAYINDRSIKTTIDSKKKVTHQKIQKGWGHDVCYSSGGIDYFVFDVENPDKLNFTKKDNKFIVTLNDQKSQSSFCIINYNPLKHAIFIRAQSQKMSTLMNKKFKNQVNLAQKSGAYTQHGRIMNAFDYLVARYDSQISKISGSPESKYNSWIKLAF